MSLSSGFRFICFALLAAGCATPHAAQDATAGLGRLFMSAEKRAMLDSMRARNLQPGRASREDVLQLDGIVRRSDGHSTVWLNGMPHHDHAPVTRLGTSTAQVVTGGGRTQDIAVGNSVRFSADESAPALKPPAMR